MISQTMSGKYVANCNSADDFQITMPASPPPDQVVTVTRGPGAAGRTIALLPNSGQTIRGASSFAFEADTEAVQLVLSAGLWRVVSQVPPSKNAVREYMRALLSETFDVPDSPRLLNGVYILEADGTTRTPVTDSTPVWTRAMLPGNPHEWAFDKPNSSYTDLTGTPTTPAANGDPVGSMVDWIGGAVRRSAAGSQWTLTPSGWFSNPSNGYADTTGYDDGGVPPVNGPGWLWYVADGSGLRILNTNAGGNCLLCHTRGGGVGTIYVNGSMNAPILSGTAKHVILAGKNTGGTWRLFFDGVEQTIPSPNSNDFGQVVLGGKFASYPEGFVGNLCVTGQNYADLSDADLAALNYSLAADYS